MDRIIQEFMNRDTYAKSIGIEITEFGKGRATAKLIINKNHLNSAGTVHGGVIFSVADAAFSVASNSHGTLAMGICATISYFKAKEKGTLIAEASEVTRNRKLATYDIRVKDEEQSLIALFNGTVYRKETQLDEIIHAR